MAKQQIELSATDGFQNTTIFFRITSGGSPNDTLLDYEKRQTVEFSVEIYFKLLPYYVKLSTEIFGEIFVLIKVARSS